MNRALYWLRQDLRLADNLVLVDACAVDVLLPVYIHDVCLDEDTVWGFPRMGTHRRVALRTAVQKLDLSLRAKGSRLLELWGDPRQLIPQLMHLLNLDVIFVERIAAPEESADIAVLKDLGFTVYDRWQSSLISPSALPFPINQLPDVFSHFRARIEKRPVKLDSPVKAPAQLPALPDLHPIHPLEAACGIETYAPTDKLTTDSCGAFPHASAHHQVDEPTAHAHLAQYLARQLPHTYKATRNQLIGRDYSSKWSPYLAHGSLSPRTILAELRQFEAQNGANEGSYWLWFELLWRDYFRFLHLKYGARLYHAAGLSQQPPPQHNPKAFNRWMAGETGHTFVDAGMRELAATGYLSNRMRQVVASYLIHELGCDWRAGAAWFESQLIDYDVYSNQGNWLYLAGRGTDPRGGRRFNPDKQAHDYDANGAYRTLWHAKK